MFYCMDCQKDKQDSDSIRLNRYRFTCLECFNKMQLAKVRLFLHANKNKIIGEINERH